MRNGFNSRNGSRNARSDKAHHRPPPEPEYPHVPTRPSWTQRHALRLPVSADICDACKIAWPCPAWLHDQADAAAELRWFWRDNGYGHASNVAAPAARSNSAAQVSA